MADFKFDICDDAYPRYTIEEFNELEQVYIKKRMTNTGQPIGEAIVYTDTYNRAWLEDELLTLEEAEALIGS